MISTILNNLKANKAKNLIKVNSNFEKIFTKNFLSFNKQNYEKKEIFFSNKKNFAKSNSNNTSDKYNDFDSLDDFELEKGKILKKIKI